ncbi:hypothetical protein ABEG18_18605 [Alsobacter sp. KACC 23698]|uniref:Uncharacterized protein n=1 Tax=Alsobacter sp. KACC 23698 TaxID=3149229 RepID=A0AAU7JBE6_9HYPH
MNVLRPGPSTLSSAARRSIGLALVACGVCAAAVGGALAQGQDSSTSTQAPHANAHPPPLLSTDSVTSVPSGKPLPGSEFPAAMRPRPASSLAPAGPVAIPTVQLACDAIQDDAARARCGALKEPKAPPR